MEHGEVKQVISLNGSHKDLKTLVRLKNHHVTLGCRFYYLIDAG